jgi:hypothetical protein
LAIHEFNLLVGQLDARQQELISARAQQVRRFILSALREGCSAGLSGDPA